MSAVLLPSRTLQQPRNALPKAEIAPLLVPKRSIKHLPNKMQEGAFKSVPSSKSLTFIHKVDESVAEHCLLEKGNRDLVHPDERAHG